MKTATQKLLTEPRPTKQSHAWGLVRGVIIALALATMGIVGYVGLAVLMGG